MRTIPYGRQYIDNKDIRFVSKALKQDLITTGNYVKKFENSIFAFLKRKRYCKRIIFAQFSKKVNINR
jgi:dTDP-4-amino-4,6-dideoxygalactose transaminase